MKSPKIVFLCIFLLFLIAQQNIFAQSAWFTTGQDADLMLSGVGFNNTGGALLFNHPMGLATDGTHLLLSDSFNNRILIWNTLPTKWNDKPDIVLGQPDFTSNNPGDSKSKLDWPIQISVGSNGVLAEAEPENDRVLIWKTFPTSNEQPADISISFDSLPKLEQNYGWPWSVWTDGKKLIATATSGGYIFFWNKIPTVDNQPFDYSIKQPEFGTPRGISTDGSTFMSVGDENPSLGDPNEAAISTGTFFWNSFPTQSNQPFDWFFSYWNGSWLKGVKTDDGKFIANGGPYVFIWNTVPKSMADTPNIAMTNKMIQSGWGDGKDVVCAGGRVYIDNDNGNDVLVYNTFPTNANQLPDFALGSPSLSYNTLDSINYIQNPVLATDGNVLIATSDFDHCLWLWKTVNPASGQAPDIKIDFTSKVKVQWPGVAYDLVPWDNALYKNKFVAAGQKKVGIWNSLPINGEKPSKIFSDSIGNVQFEDLKGIALDSSFLYLGESSGKIYIWKNIPVTGSENPVYTITLPTDQLNRLNSDGKYLCATTQGGPAIYIFRVSDIEKGNLSPYKKIVMDPLNPNQLPLNLPGDAITFNGSFAIANTCNNAVFLWKNVEDAGDISKVIILGQDSLKGLTPAIGKNRLYWPASLCACKNYLWVGEFKFSSRILRFSYDDNTGINDFAELNQDSLQIYPNPSIFKTVIKYNVQKYTHVLISVYSASDKLVTTLVNEEKEPGNYITELDDSNLSNGIYFCRMHAGNFIETKKIIVQK